MYQLGLGFAAYTWNGTRQKFSFPVTSMGRWADLSHCGDPRELFRIPAAVFIPHHGCHPQQQFMLQEHNWSPGVSSHPLPIEG